VHNRYKKVDLTVFSWCNVTEIFKQKEEIQIVKVPKSFKEE